ncbi:1-phosphofructokinase [Stigmatella erecta]|uniref:1-phosphofructokinase n=1 Tax=Stigmatella erecta TaxID=83460 RepID=A0A1H9ZED5_9BACT|nr:1-phosphofructokinase [Stigmatella erecta]SES79877.1 1-phosphofructokinase [Stigmatella erecta]
MARVLTLTLNPALDLAIRLGVLQPGEVNRAESTRLDAGGKGINVARVLTGLGHDVSVSGLLGTDNEAPFVKAFTELGMRDAFIRVPGETRINAKISEAGGRVTDLNGPGLRIPEHALEALKARLGTLASGHEAVVVAGSLPPNVSPAQLAGLITAIRELGLPVWLDTSGPALTSGLAARPTGIKPNETELEGWAGRRLETAEARLQAALRLNAEGIEDVLVSAGAGSVLWAQRGTALEAVPPRVTVLSTVGAGDTLLAGALHGLLSGWPRERTLRFATALAAECVRHVGVGDPKAMDFEALQRQTVVRNPSTGETLG